MELSRKVNESEVQIHKRDNLYMQRTKQQQINNDKTLRFYKTITIPYD